MKMIFVAMVAMVIMVTVSSKSNIFFLCCISVNVIWQIITMVLTSKQREKLRIAEMSYSHAC
jgi:hypothetical protein